MKTKHPNLFFSLDCSLDIKLLTMSTEFDKSFFLNETNTPLITKIALIFFNIFGQSY